MKGDSKRGAKTPTETAGSSVNTDRIRQEGKQKIIYSTRNITIITYTGWSREFSPITVDPFSKERGPTVPITCDPKELFSLFLGDDVVDLIVRETNTYAEQCLAETGEMWSTQQLRSGHTLDSTF